VVFANPWQKVCINHPESDNILLFPVFIYSTGIFFDKKLFTLFLSLLSDEASTQAEMKEWRCLCGEIIRYPLAGIQSCS